MDTLGEPLVVLDSSFTVVNAIPAFLRTFKTERDETIGRSLFQLGDGERGIQDLWTLLAEVPKAKAIVGYQVSHNFTDLRQQVIDTGSLLAIKRISAKACPNDR